MIALLSALLGFLSSAVPDFMKLYRDQRDHAHELQVLKLQMEHARALQQAGYAEDAHERALRLEAIQMEAQRAEGAALNTRLREQLTGIHWVDALAGSVRPILTYGFFLLYVGVKIAQFSLLQEPTLPWLKPVGVAEALVMVWNEEDVAIFSAIMAFWFGSRIMRQGRRA